MAADNIRNVEDYFPFIIETVSEVTGRYVETENSIELSIAMEKFIEADRSYDEEKGSFMTYLKVLIRNGVIDYLRKQNKTIVDSDIVNDRIGNESGVHEKAQLLRYEKLLRKYSVSFESLAVKGPKHKETRLRMVRLAKEMTKDNTVIHHLKEKKRLPITYISRNYDVSAKVIKTHKLFVVAVLLAYIEGVDVVTDWIDEL